jgi:peptide/nickel transport system ATP-binding protein
VGLTLLGDARRGARIAAGTVLIDGEDVLALADEDLRSLRGNAVAYIPQDPSAALNPALSIGRQIEELFEFHRPLASAAEIGARIRETLEEVHLPTEPAFLRRYPHQLSGGQQQRIVIAMAFVLRPQVIVLDEPTTGLDVTTQAQVLRTVRDLCAIHRVAALYVTHDLAVVGNLTHRIAVMYAGRLVEVGTTEQLFREPTHPYTRRLIAAVPLVSECRELVAIPGQAPAPGARPEGCSFHPRCEDALPECERAEARRRCRRGSCRPPSPG